MRRRSILTGSAMLLAFCSFAWGDESGKKAISVKASDTPSTTNATLFAFDDHSIPWQDNLQLTLVQAEKHPDNPVLRTGPEGSPDHAHALIYGSVLKIGDKFRMWYLGMGPKQWPPGPANREWWRPMCYAESDDGIHWVKPKLGLVEYNGNKDNNICQINSADPNMALVNDYLTVIYDPEDPNSERRYKCAYIAHIKYEEFTGGVRLPEHGKRERRLCSMICAVSADGLTWNTLGDRPSVNEKYEVAGLYKFGNFYYATGQQISPWVWRADGSDIGRAMTTFRSPDMEKWSSSKALSFARPGQLTSTALVGQQTHMGAGMWNRGNVLVGLYGMWQDGPKERPKGSNHLYGMRIDLGLVVSNDGIHFREPVADFKVIPHGKEGEWDAIALTQGHAFANVGDKTYLWYGNWDCEMKYRGQEIGLATLRRDGFGYLSRREKSEPGHFVTCLIKTPKEGSKLFVNVDGVSKSAPLTVELVDEYDRPLAGYSGADAAKLVAEGVEQPVVWPKSTKNACPTDGRFAVKVSFPKNADAKVYAVYAIE